MKRILSVPAVVPIPLRVESAHRDGGKYRHFDPDDRSPQLRKQRLYRDVMDRWGPIVQPGPSVRYVPSGAVFNSLAALPCSRKKSQWIPP